MSPVIIVLSDRINMVAPRMSMKDVLYATLNLM